MTTLNLIGLYTASIDTTRDFYATLGLIFQRDSAPLSLRFTGHLPAAKWWSVGSLRLGFGVQSVDRTVQTLRERQVKAVSEPKDLPWGRRAVVTDPNGNRGELTKQL